MSFERDLMYRFCFLALFCSIFISFKKYKAFSRGLGPGSKVCSAQMIDWQYFSLGYLEQNELFPKSIRKS